MRRLTTLLCAILFACQPPGPASDAASDGEAAGTAEAVGGFDRPVTADRLLNAEQEPHNWLMYSGQYNSQRFSSLDRIDRASVSDLQVEWVHQFETLSVVETSPVVVDGLMIVTESPSNVIALDAATGRPFWRYDHPIEGELALCCGQNNRGVAVLGDRLYHGTVDGRLLALDARTGSVLWNVEVGAPEEGFSITSAPLIVGDKVVTGVGGGEYGVRGYLDAYDAETGERLWRFYTIPGPGEPGNETWGGDSWRYGGAPTWLTGSYDPETNLIYWGTGNPGPDWNGDVRPGDNLYSDAVVALDADTGELEWYFQFTPHDTHDWDAIQIPVLADLEVDGEERELMLWSNRNGFYYVLDRVTGEFLHATAFAKQTWAERIDENGRPVVIPGLDPSEEGTVVFPSIVGATNWNSPSFSPRSGLFYTYAYDGGEIYYKREADYETGELYLGGYGRDADHRENYTAAIRALDPLTGELEWEYSLTPTYERSGILSTGGGLVFAGSGDGYFFALDESTGESLWHVSVGGPVHAAPMTYAVDGRQYVSVAANHALFTFALPE